MLRIHLFSIFTIKTPRALAALSPLGLLIVKTLTHVLLLNGEKNTQERKLESILAFQRASVSLKRLRVWLHKGETC